MNNKVNFIIKGEGDVIGGINIDLIIPSKINGKKITKIGYNAFGDCNCFTSVVIPNGITSIDDFAFDHCETLREVTIPSSVIFIGFKAFYSCINLSTINYTGTKEQWDTIEIRSENGHLINHATVNFNYKE